MRVVLDTDAVISALLFSGVSSKLVSLWQDGLLTPLLSREILDEYLRVLSSLTELRSGSRRGKLPAVRVKIVQGLVEDYGVPIAEAARQVGISTSGVSKILTRSLSS